jgi:hypothetical protein
MSTKMDEYRALAHAMQTGVAAQMQFDPVVAGTTPKHLRVGVNSALVDSSALAKLLMDKGVITLDEYETALVEGMRAERDRYVAWLEGRGMRVDLF